MAWIIGCANKEEIAAMEADGYEVEKVTEEQEIALFVGPRETEPDDPDRMVMVYIDVNISQICKEVEE